MQDSSTMNVTHPLLFTWCIILTLNADATAQNGPGQAAPPKDFLKQLVGPWEGTCRTWFQPDKLADESVVSQFES